MSRQDWEKVFTDGKKMPSDVVELCEKLGVEESVVSLLSMEKSSILVTELKVIRVNSARNVEWEHSFHRDVITSATLDGQNLTIKEFNGETYSIDVSTGEQLK